MKNPLNYIRYQTLIPIKSLTKKSNSLISQLFIGTVIIIIFICFLNKINHTDNSSKWNVRNTTTIDAIYQNITDKLTNKYIKEFNDKIMNPLNRLLSELDESPETSTNTANLILPKRVQMNNSQTFQLVERDSNLAATYWQWWNENKKDNKKNRKKNVNYCEKVRLTSPTRVRHNNLYWQQFNAVPEDKRKETLRMYLYNAYYDKRIEGAPVVKFVTMNSQEMMGNERNWWCLLWFDKIKSPALVKVSDYYNIWPSSWRRNIKYGSYHPQLISCPVPKEHSSDVPRAASLQARGDCNKVEKEPSNVLRVIYNKREPKLHKPSIGICVQAFRFGTYDVSVRLVEWLEMVRLLGADKAYFYVYGTNDNIQQVLQHYQTDGLVNWRHLTLPGQQVNVNSLYNTLAYQLGDYFWPSESLELNDCLYRNIYRHDYLAVIDIDEVIMPQNATNWHELIKRIESGLSEKDRKLKAYYSSRHSHVCEQSEEFNYELANSHESIPDYLYMSRHTFRAKVLGKTQNNKCFHRTDRVLAVHNHFPMRCIGTTGYLKCPGLTIDPNQSILLHYRRNRSSKSSEKKKTPEKCDIHDRTIWRFYDSMSKAVKNKLEKIFG